MIVQEQDTTHFCRDPPIINNVRFIFVSIHKLTVRKIRLDSTDSLMTIEVVPCSPLLEYSTSCIARVRSFFFSHHQWQRPTLHYV